MTLFFVAYCTTALVFVFDLVFQGSVIREINSLSGAKVTVSPRYVSAIQ